MKKHYIHTKGQAVVEFALAATLIFLLLGAAVDLGLMFFTVQGLHNAAQEGATYGSRWLITKDNRRQLNVAEIQERVRTESGASASNGFVNLLDLDTDGTDDTSQGTTVIDPTGANGSIRVVALQDANRDGNPTNDNQPCTNPESTTSPCYVLVTVTKTYDVFFPFIPAFADTFPISSSYYMLIRDSFAQAGTGPQSFPTPEPTRGPSNIIVNISYNAVVSKANQTGFEVTAWDTAYGTTNGAGIKNVTIDIRSTTGASYTKVAGPLAQPRYCAYPSTNNNSCGTISKIDSMANGTYIITATVESNSGQTATRQVTFTRTN
jgi:Flp pilus assembly protein TadG